jgi:hypothetical protein
MIRRFRSVIPDVLYRGSGPTPKDVLELKDKLGIKKIVSLDQETGEKIDRACKMLGINHIKLYIDHTRKSLYDFLSQDMKKLFLEGGPTFVHCHEGKDRTGLASAIVECRFLGKDPEKAIQEAKALGFGVGIPPQSVHMFEQIIRHCKPDKDTNSADIVSNEREYIGDNRDTFLDEGHQGSFSPHLNQTKQDPVDSLYPSDLDQYPTRENYDSPPLFRHDPSESVTIPNVGEYDNDAGQRGFGPVERMDGFFSEVGH